MSGLSPYSKRRRRRDASYQAARVEVHERAQGRCEVAATVACTGRAEQTHHVAGRVGPAPHDPENLLAVCFPCHDAIHRYPAKARERGFMRSRLGRVGDFTGRQR